MPALKRNAVATKSPKSPKKAWPDAKKLEALEGEIAETLRQRVAEIDAASFLDQAIPLLRGVIMRQMEENQTSPDEPKEASRRGRDSATLSSLVRSLERLNRLDKSREARDRKNPRNDVELKERFVRRLDQLLANEPKTDAARKPDGR